MTAALQHLAYNPDNIKPGWVAFVVVMALCVATFFLWRSMNTQLRRIKVPPEEGAAPSADGAPSSDDSADQASDDDEDPPPNQA